jgi:hypothetical protein
MHFLRKDFLFFKSMTNYTVLAKYRNKEQVEFLIGKIRDKGYSCYNFCDKPADPDNPSGDPADQMQVFESVSDFYNNKYYKDIFETDLTGLKNAEKVIVFLPAGNAVHIEAGIAYGLGKKLILIGEVEKPETLYLIFEERYGTIEEFLDTI